MIPRRIDGLNRGTRIRMAGSLPTREQASKARRWVLTAAAALIAGAVATGRPAAAEGDPAAFVGNLGNQLQSVASIASPGERQAGFRQLFHQDFDVRGLGRFVLGRYWRVFTRPERRQFLCLFDVYVVLAYSDRLSQYAADGAVPKVIGSRPDPHGVIVSSRVERGAAQPINVDWRLKPTHHGGYKISDVVIGGLSLAANGRTELQGVVERNGGRPQSIIAVMRQQIAGAQAGDLAAGCR